MDGMDHMDDMDNMTETDSDALALEDAVDDSTSEGEGDEVRLGYRPLYIVTKCA